MGQQINARDWVFEVTQDPDAGTPVWAEVGGLETFTMSPSEGEETVDTTTFSSGGIAESKVMQRGAKLQLEGKVERTAGTQDAGQVACNTLAGKLGDESLGGVRFRHQEDDDWTVWHAIASLSDVGGGKNDQTSWGCSFTRSGAASVVAVTP